MQYPTSFTTQNDQLETVGGKGRSLVRLTKQGFNVPKGFLIPTSCYLEFIDHNDLRAKILDSTDPKLDGHNVSFKNASEHIQSLIHEGEIPKTVEEQIVRGYQEFSSGSTSVAVRSSANAEDLPNLSFAGQQETFLGVRGIDSVKKAVQKCWASLWTAQAMSYRHQNGIDHRSVAMCVIVQHMVESEVSGILFTANPSTGERSEIVVNARFGLGVSVVGGLVTPDTFIVDRQSKTLKLAEIGSKEQETVSSGLEGTTLRGVDEDRQSEASLDHTQIEQLVTQSLKIEATFDNVPQDIEWAFKGNDLYILQSRPITNLPVQPIEINWEVPPPATYVSRRQIVENMPDPICPLFEELYLIEGLESSRKGHNLMVGGGPMFITVNGYAYQRFDFAIVHQQAKEKGLLPVSEEEIEAAEMQAVQNASKKAAASKTGEDGGEEALRKAREAQLQDLSVRERDVDRFRSELNDVDQKAFDAWVETNDRTDLARELTMPQSKNPTYVAFNNTEWNDRQLGEWFKVTRPRLQSIKEKWDQLDVASASDQKLLDGIREMGIEEGYYWSSNSSHTFGVAKSTDDQLQCFLRETLPDHHFISGQFLSGIESKTMQANADLFEIAQAIRENQDLKYLVAVTPIKYLFDVLKTRNDSKDILQRIENYLNTYGHQGYSLDFVEPTQIEEPSALFASLRAMVADLSYDPSDQDKRALSVREAKYQEITELLDGLQYWQFRFRLWLARKYNYIREEVAFLFGYTWSILRPMAHELGVRLEASGSLLEPNDLYFLRSEEIQEAINARSNGVSRPELAELATERRELREARKRHHPPGTLPTEASQIDGIAFKETQILNLDDSSLLKGFPVSSGTVTARASVINNASEFDKMEPGTILVSPLTTPAWTQLFSHAVGLVTDVGSILAHGSIVAREYGIPAVLGVGNGTKRIQHGQVIAIDGDRGIVELEPQSESLNE